jgi:DNA-binding XRE family transcriptional regulator
MSNPFVLSIRELRERAKYSQTAAAALASVAPGTWVRYELDRDAVSRERRARCDEAAGS